MATVLGLTGWWLIGAAPPLGLIVSPICVEKRGARAALLYVEELS
jgi:hypothetical protein